MCYRRWKRFPRILLGEHDIEAFFAFLSLVYWVFASAPKGGPVPLQQRDLRREIAKRDPREPDQGPCRRDDAVAGPSLCRQQKAR